MTVEGAVSDLDGEIFQGISPAEMGRSFQSQVVAMLSELQVRLWTPLALLNVSVGGMSPPINDVV